jgi:GNAT superfamily N-acetyltransferase
VRYDSAVLERVAQRFRRDMWDSVVPEAVSESGVEVERFGPVQATAFGDLPEIHLLQQIQGAAEPTAVADGHLAAAVEWMRAREVDYRIPVASGRPGASEAAAWLDERGYEQGTGWVKLVRDGSPPDFAVDPSIVIYRLGEDEAEGEGLSTIAAEALEMPLVAGTLFFSLPQRDGWHCYTAALGPEEIPVATGSMLITDGVAQLGAGQTLAPARGRGCNAALLHRRLLDAHLAGCHTVFVEVGECDLASWSAITSNLQRAGFEEAYEGRNWQRPALHPAEMPERFSG